MNSTSSLIGRKVYVKSNIESMFAGEWGVVVDFDGQDYHVALYGGEDHQIILARYEFTVSRKAVR